jgi:hypothetical protein
MLLVNQCDAERDKSDEKLLLFPADLRKGTEFILHSLQTANQQRSTLMF